MPVSHEAIQCNHCYSIADSINIGRNNNIIYPTTDTDNPRDGTSSSNQKFKLFYYNYRNDIDNMFFSYRCGIDIPVL